MYSIASVRVSVCLSVCHVQTVESIDLKTLFLVPRYMFRISRSRSTQGHRVKVAETKRVFVAGVGGMLSLKLAILYVADATDIPKRRGLSFHFPG